MSGLFSSKTKSSSESKTQVPQNYQNFLNQSLQKASEASSAPFQQYQGQRIADLSGNEQMGIQGAANNYGMYQPLVDMATMSSADLATKAGRAPTSGEMGQFINPYTDYVLGNSLDRLQEQSDINMTKIGSQAGMSGAFGGLRHGVLEGANLSELLKSARDLSGTTYADAYDKGMGNWWKSQDSQRASIDTLLGTAKGGQAYNQGDISQLMQTGLTERTRNQGLLDFNFGEFMREQEDPLTKASFMSSIAAQYPRDIFTKTTKSESTTTDSPIKTLAGIGIAAAGIMSGNPAAAMSLGAGAGSLGSQDGVANPQTNYRTMAKGGKVKGYKKGGKVNKDPLASINPEALKEVADSWTLGNMSYYAENAPTRAEYLKRLIDNQQHAQRRLGQYELGDLRNFSSNSAADGNASQEEYMKQILSGQAQIDDFNKPGPKDSMAVVREGSRSGDRYNRPDLQNQDRALSEALSDMSPEDLNKYLEHIGKYGTPVDEPDYIFSPKPDYLWDALEGTKFPSKSYEYWQASPQKIVTALSRQKAKERKYTNPSKYAEGGFLDGIQAWGDNRDMGMVKAGLSMVAGADPLEAMDAYKEHQRYLQGSYAGGGRIGPSDNPKGLKIPAPDTSDRALEYFLRSFDSSPATEFESNMDEATYLRREMERDRVEKEQQRLIRYNEHGRKNKALQQDLSDPMGSKGNPLEAAIRPLLTDMPAALGVPLEGEPAPINESELVDYMKQLQISKALGMQGKTLRLEKGMPKVYIDDSQFKRVPNDPGYDTRGERYPGEFRSGRKKNYAEGGEVKGYFVGGLANASQMDYEAMGFSPKGIEFANNIARGRSARRGQQEPLATAMPTQQPFNWDRFNQARALNGQQTNLTGNMQPRPSLGARPDLSGYMTAIQSRMQPQQPTFAGGGYVKKFDKGGDVFVGGRGFGPPTDPLAAISEKFAPLPDVSEGINPEIIYSLATQKHETGSKEYGKPNYNARPLDENKVPLSSAAGLGQWLAESWNQIAKRDKSGTIKPRTYKQAMEGHIPSKEEQRLAWPIWMEIQKEQMGEENFNKLNNRFAHHQLGQGDYSKLLQANPDKKMREVFGDKVARNVSAYSKDKKGNVVKNETVYQYLNRLDKSMKDAEAWYLQNQENPGDVVYYGGLDPQAVARKSLPKQAVAEVDPLAGIADVEKRSRAIDAMREKEQYDADRQNWRNDLNIAQLGSNEIQMSPMEGGPRTQGRPVSPQENIANKIKSKTPIEALELFATQSKYSDPIDQMLYAPKVFPGTGTTKKNYRQEQLDKFLKSKGVSTKDVLSDAWNSDVDSKMQEVIGDLGIENEGPYRKGGRNFADGSVGKGPIMRDSKGNVIPQSKQTREPHWSDRLHEALFTPASDAWGDINDFIATTGNFGYTVGESNRGKVPTEYPIIMPLKQQSPLEQAQPSVPKGAFSGPNFFDSASDDVAAYYSELGDMTGADPLNAALAQGEPSAPMADAVGSGIAKDDDEAMLKKMMHDRIIAMNEDKGPQQPTLFGLNVNMDLVKLGLGMLASDKNFGGALGEAGMNLIQSKEQEELRKSKENSNKLQELLDLRYKNAMMESMDPEVRAELARQKAASDMQLERLKHQSKLDELQIQQSSILSKNIAQKEIERIQAKMTNDEMLTESEKSMLWSHGIDYEQPIKAGSWLDLD